MSGDGSTHGMGLVWVVRQTWENPQSRVEIIELQGAFLSTVGPRYQLHTILLCVSVCILSNKSERERERCASI